MGQVQGEQKHGEDVKAGDDDALKAIDHHGIDVVPVERISFEEKEAGIRHPDGKMGEVVDDEGEDDEAAQPHVTRSEGGFDVFFARVGHRSRLAVLEREPDREINVQHHVQEKKRTDQPKEGAERTQMLGVAVNPLGPEEDLQVPEEVADDKAEQNQAGERYDEFLPDRRAIKTGELSHNGDSTATLRWIAEPRRRVLPGQESQGPGSNR